MKRKMFINELVIGEKITDLIVILVYLKQPPEGGFFCVLRDKTGEIDAVGNGILPENLLDAANVAVKITAICIPGENRKPILRLKSICLADRSEYQSSDLVQGLSKEKIGEYISLIHKRQKNVRHDGYSRLLTCCLDDATLQQLANMPATLGFYGRYPGGALAGAACIAEMVTQAGCTYVTQHNGLYPVNINWSLLLTAALLNTYGVLGYLTPEAPYKKTAIGVDRGYTSILQSKLEHIIYVNQLPLLEAEVSRLLNVICCAVSQRTSIKATSKEGILLRHMLALYAELDMLDCCIAEQASDENDDEYFYSQFLRRYIAQR